VQILEIKEGEVWSWPVVEADESKTIMVIFDGDERSFGRRYFNLDARSWFVP